MEAIGGGSLVVADHSAQLAEALLEYGTCWGWRAPSFV